jgi:RNA recognition motif-containing protein
MNIFVGSLPFSLSEADLSKYFEQYGEVSSVKIISDKFTGRSKGFGFVDMPDDSQAQNALDALNGSEINGRSIVVNKAEERKERPREFNNNRSGGGGGFNRNGGGNRTGGGGFNRGGGNRY